MSTFTFTVKEKNQSIRAHVVSVAVAEQRCGQGLTMFGVNWNLQPMNRPHPLLIFVVHNLGRHKQTELNSVNWNLLQLKACLYKSYFKVLEKRCGDLVSLLT